MGNAAHRGRVEVSTPSFGRELEQQVLDLAMDLEKLANHESFRPRKIGDGGAVATR